VNNAFDWWQTYRAALPHALSETYGHRNTRAEQLQSAHELAAGVATRAHGPLCEQLHMDAVTPHGRVQFSGEREAVVFAANAFSAGANKVSEWENVESDRKKGMT
jgi:hypothetical protein